jgi:hypothetical protein
MKTLVGVPSRKGYINTKGFGFKAQCAQKGRSIYQEMPIQRVEMTPRPQEPMMGQGLQVIKGSTPVPQKKDLSGLTSILSSVSIGDRRKGRSKIKL